MDEMPAHRGKKLEAKAIGDPQSVAWDDAENRMHVQKGLMKYLLQGSDGCVRARLRHGLAAAGLAPPLTRYYAGLVKVSGPHVPADWGAARLLKP